MSYQWKELLPNKALPVSVSNRETEFSFQDSVPLVFTPWGNGVFWSLLDSVFLGPSPRDAPGGVTEYGFRGSGQEGRRAGWGYSRTPAVPGREPEPGRVTLALAEKSSQGRVRGSERPRAGGGEVGHSEGGE